MKVKRTSSQVQIDDSSWCVEFLEGGNLRSYVQNKENQLTLELVLQFLRGIAAGMLHLSNENMVHRDLAARNILVGVDMDVIHSLLAYLTIGTKNLW